MIWVGFLQHGTNKVQQGLAWYSVEYEGGHFGQLYMHDHTRISGRKLIWCFMEVLSRNNAL
jgi:hypothetical protein